METGEPLPASRLRTRLCAACCVFCDEVVVEESGAVVDDGARVGEAALPGRLRVASGACTAGAAWLESPRDLAVIATARGHAVDRSEAIGRAAEILTDARAPAVVIGPSLTVEAQREAVRLAELLRAAVFTSVPPAPGSERIGLDAPELTATLGEVRSTADLVIFWEADPTLVAPRHLELYSGDPPLRSGSRRVIAVVRAADAPRSALSERADRVVEADTGAGSLELALRLRLALREESGAGRRAGDAGAGELAAAMRDARHTHIVLGPRAAGDPLVRDVLQGLAAERRLRSRISIGALLGGGNVRGALDVTTWLLGAPPPLATALGGPPASSWLPGCSSLEDLTTGAADVVLLCGPTPPQGPGANEGDSLPPSLGEALRLSLDTHDDRRAELSFRVPGLDPRLHGTVVRLDGSFLALGGDLSDPAVETLHEISRAARALARGRGAGPAPAATGGAR